MKNEDLISREEALKVVNAYDYRDFTVEQVKTITDGCAEEISRLPAVDAEPVRYGKWGDQCRGKERVCSCCKHNFDNTCNDIDNEWMFCPHCGARMDEGVSGDGKAQD